MHVSYIKNTSFEEYFTRAELVVKPSKYPYYLINLFPFNLPLSRHHSVVVFAVFGKIVRGKMLVEMEK